MGDLGTVEKKKDARGIEGGCEAFSARSTLEVDTALSIARHQEQQVISFIGYGFVSACVSNSSNSLQTTAVQGRQRGLSDDSLACLGESAA